MLTRRCRSGTPLLVKHGNLSTNTPLTQIDKFWRTTIGEPGRPEVAHSSGYAATPGTGQCPPAKAGQKQLPACPPQADQHLTRHPATPPGTREQPLPPARPAATLSRQQPAPSRYPCRQAAPLTPAT